MPAVLVWDEVAEADEAVACKGSCKLADAPVPLEADPPLMPLRMPLPLKVLLPPLTRPLTYLPLPLLFPLPIIVSRGTLFRQSSKLCV